MSRRASLPGAAELFRNVGPGEDPAYPDQDGDGTPVHSVPERRTEPEDRGQSRAGTVRRTSLRRSGKDHGPSGRERHDEKITVYVSADELFDLEQARLLLRGSHGLAVDRGRIVREAVSLVLADFEAKGDSSILVRRLRQA